MSSSQRRRCCCDTGGEPPATCDCTGCPSSLAFAIAASLTMTFDDGVNSWYWHWSYSGLAGIFGGLGTGGACGAAAENDELDGTMDWEQTYDPSEPASGSCDLPLDPGDLVDSLVAFGCGPTLFSTLAQAVGVSTPTYWFVSITPIPRRDAANQLVCDGSPFGPGGNSTSTQFLPTMTVYFERHSGCWDAPPVKGLYLADAVGAGAGCTITGGGGSCTDGNYTFAGSASVSLT